MFFPLHGLFELLVQTGNLRVTDSHGKTHVFGDGTGTPIGLNIKDRRTERAIAIDPALALGEAYMSGRAEITEGSIYDLLALALRNSRVSRQPLALRLATHTRYAFRHLAPHNSQARARRNVVSHYDIDDRIYRLFLDSDWQYSCAYFESPDADLETAQRAKQRHIAAKLALKPGQTVLDIGSGWGGLALYLARAADVNVTGITLSDNQLAAARRRATESGLDDLVRFELRDYRNLNRPFDRIVSVGMLEHVGVAHFDAYFRQLERLLAEEGVALIHAIGRIDGPGATNPFIAKYIFPGGYFPALSEVLPAIERSGLIVTDIELLRLHYANTLRAWRKRFVAHRDDVIRLKSEDFYRMWEFYLAGSEAAFRYDQLLVFQIQLSKNLDTLPLTRDYMGRAEKQLLEREKQLDPSVRLAGE